MRLSQDEIESEQKRPNNTQYLDWNNVQILKYDLLLEHAYFIKHM